jgi:hypothetical protein
MADNEQNTPSVPYVITEAQLTAVVQRIAENLGIIADVASDALTANAATFTGATSVQGGAAGLVPAPIAGDDEKFLRGDGSWVTVSTGSGGAGGGNTSYSQITKMNVIATGANPKEVDITIPSSRYFPFGPVEVLKFESSTTGVVTTACGFDNGDASDFNFSSNYVTFDGTMHLKTSYTRGMSTPAALGSGYFSQSATINPTAFKTFESLEAGGALGLGVVLVQTGSRVGTWAQIREQTSTLLLDSDGDAYDTEGTLVASNWSGLTNSQKETAFGSSSDTALTNSVAQTIGEFQVMCLASDNSQQTCSFTAIPQDQLIVPQGLIDLSSYEIMQGAAITDSTSGNAKVLMAVTPDGTNYYVYNTATEEWDSITATAAAIVAGGMTKMSIANIPADAWTALTGDGEAVGFAYVLSMSASSETCYVDQIDLTVDMKGKWRKAVHGTDYDYAYTSNTNLKVQLFANGNYKINHAAG